MAGSDVYSKQIKSSATDFPPAQVQKLDAIVHKHRLHTKIPGCSAYGIHTMIVSLKCQTLKQRKNSSDGCCDLDSMQTHMDVSCACGPKIKIKCFCFDWNLNATSPLTHTHTQRILTHSWVSLEFQHNIFIFHLIIFEESCT